MKLDMDPSERLSERVRERVLVALLRSFSLGAWVIAGITGLQATLHHALTPTLMVGTGAGSGLVTLLLIRRYVPYRLVALLFICLAWLIATYLQSFHGLTPSTTLGAVAFMLIASMFLGLRAIGWVFVLTLVSLLGSAVLILSGWVEPWPDVFWDPREPLVWLRYLAILLFLGGGLAISFAYLVRGLERAAQRATQLAAAQRAEQAKRESMQDALEQARRHEAISRFAGGLAHEFSDSLVAILALSHRIEHDPQAPAHVTALAASIRLGVESASEIAHGLLALSRSEAVAPRLIELGVVLRRTEHSLRRLFASEVELVVEAQTDEQLFVDPSQLEQALVSIALNARDAMPTGGRFRVSVSDEPIDDVPAGWKASEGSFVVITCTDTGRGMDRETQRRVFEPFFTTKASTRGLGLAIVRGFVYDACGFMTVHSEPGRGTAFALYIPRPAKRSKVPFERAFLL
jgi:signal transduction histidine kinase